MITGLLVVAALHLAPVPGDLNPAVTQATIHKTICVPGYTKTIRPPVKWTDALKRTLMQSQHLKGKPRDYELDHFIPLELGGAPKSLKNLWMQPLAEARVKDQEESSLHHVVCLGNTTLKDAQDALKVKWGGTVK